MQLNSTIVLPHKSPRKFHQGDSRFGYSSVIKCSCNTLLSICYSKFRSPIAWKFHDFDFILTEGDSNFKQLGFQETTFVDQFPRMISVEGQECKHKF